MTTFFVFILTISIVIGIHEFGHFQMARWCNVKVLKFSIGFGKRINKQRTEESHYDIITHPTHGFGHAVNNVF